MKVTIHNLSVAKEQQVFDTISTHLLRQKSRSELYTEKTCAYRSEDGKACAIGCLIPIEDYKPEYERSGWAQLLDDYEDLPRRHENFLSILQSIHDAYDPSDWSNKLRFIAESNQLDLNEEFIKLEEECKRFFLESNNSQS